MSDGTKKSLPSLIRVIAAIIAVVLVLVTAPTLMLSWFTHYDKTADSDFTPTSQEGTLIAKYYDGDSWESIDADNAPIEFGEMQLTTELPAKQDAYFMFGMSATQSNEDWKYKIIIETITIAISKRYEPSIPDDDENIAKIHYFTDDETALDQRCIDYSYYFSNNNEVSLTNITWSSKSQISQEDLSLTGDELIAHDSYIYVRLSLRLTELQNIIKYIAMEYMPYYIDFTATYKGEKRTV